MFAVFNNDIHFARDTGKLTSSGIGRHGYGKLRYALGHDAGVIQDKRAAPSLQRSADFFNCHINSGTLWTCAGIAAREHLPFASTFKIAVVLLINRHPAQRWIDLVVLRRQLYIEWSSGMHGSGCSFLGGGLGL